VAWEIDISNARGKGGDGMERDTHRLSRESVWTSVTFLSLKRRNTKRRGRLVEAYNNGEGEEKHWRSDTVCKINKSWKHSTSNK